MRGAPVSCGYQGRRGPLRPIQASREERFGPRRFANRGSSTFRQEFVGGTVDSEVPTARILRAAGGNPLALELLAREWIEHGPESLLRDLEALDTHPVPHLGIPRAITAVLERQRTRLDGTTKATLDLAAVLGRRLTDLRLYQLSKSHLSSPLNRCRD